jgi:outer membrane receptor protein involved in Fe transport
VKITRIGRKAVLLLSVFGIGFTAQTTVFAQDQEEAVLEEITVTGSRIVRRDYSAQTPIVTIEAETFTERTNFGLEAALNQLPQFNVAGTQSQQSAAGTPFPQATAAPGAATVDLRGLGLNRTLVLLDGRRVQPVNGLLVVDLNTIPAAAIDRVEVITGGAASVYGADAISGVVNFILKRNFEGLEFSGQYGLSEHGDGGETSINGLFGADISGGRGNVMLGVDYATRDVIYGRDRDWVVEGWDDPGTNAGGLGSSNLSQFVSSAANAPTAGFLAPGATYYVDQNGSLFNNLDPLNAANPYTGPLGAGTDYKLNPDGSLGYNDRVHNYLQLPLDRYALFGSASFEVADGIELFTTARFAETHANSKGFVSGVFNVWSPTIPYNSLYDDPNSPTFGQAPPGTAQHPVPAALGALLSSRPMPDEPWTYAGGLDYLRNFETDTTSNVYQVIGGLRGDASIGSRDWNWEIYASHGKTTVNAQQPEGFPFLPRLQNLFNANQYGRDFDISSLPGFFPLAVTGHCTSGLPIFNPDGGVNDTPSVSKDCADYVVLRLNSITTLSQDIAEANVSGDILEMPAGDLLFALGAAYRKEDFGFDPDSGYNANQDFPNVVQNIILPVTVDGSTDVTEIYAELAIPLIRGKKFIQSFEIDPGVRYSDYNTVGSVSTAKLLFDWTVNDRLRFRGGQQVATRAPNITELFTPRGGSQLVFGAQDSCGSWAATQIWGNVPGNPNRLNLQTLCQELMVRDGAPPTLYEPGQPSADNWMYNVFGATFNFPASIGITEGNPDLESEEADTVTFGAVLSFDRVTLSVDWYQIELEHTIGTPAFGTVYQQCMDPGFNPLISSAPGTYTGAELAAGNPFCDLINREYIGGAPLSPGNFGAARTFDARYINQGGLTSQGLDIQLDWRFDVGGGSLNLNLQTSFLDTYSESAFPGAIPVDYTGTSFNSSFDYKTFSSLRYDKASWSVGLRWQHLPALGTQEGSAADLQGINAHDQLDLFTRYSFGEKYQLRAGIDNLLDARPEVVGATSTNNNLGATSTDYDTFGRRLFVGLSVSL